MIDTFTSTFKYNDIHNMLSNVQVHTVGGALPPKTNHNFSYEYAGAAGPHRATKIGDTLLTYDENGNTLRECRDQADPTCTVSHNQLRQYFWDEDNRLTSVVDGGGRHTTSFLYDAAGERVVKQGRGGDSITVGQWFNAKGSIAATKHVYAGETRLASKLLPPPGDWTTTGTTLVSATTTTSSTTPTTKVRPETYYYHSDHLGSTSWVTDQNGRVHEHVDYFPYGAVWRDPRSDSDRGPTKTQAFLFTSKELDEETGLYYFGARYYDARRAKWINPDPAMLEIAGGGNPIGLSTYAYAFNNPSRYVDPDGEAASEWAESWEKHGRAQYRQALANQITPETSGGELVGLALTTLSVELGAGVVDILRLGEGVAEGGWGYFHDAARALGGFGLLKMATPSPRAPSSSQARQTAVEQANLAQQQSPRPGAASGLVTTEGQTFSGVSCGGQRIHPIVQRLLDAVPPRLRSPLHSKCAEVACLSKALDSAAWVRGGTMSTVKVRGRGNSEHAAPLPPCSSCSFLLKKLNIKTVEGGS
jgi:RHS repeat-associated protein